MGWAVLVSGALTIGMSLIVLALVWPVWQARQMRHRYALARLGGHGDALAQAPVALVLRRRQAGRGIGRLLGFEVEGAALLRLHLTVLAVAFALSLGLLWLTRHPGLFILGLIVPILGAALWRGRQARRRLAEIDQAVPEALEMIIRSLRIGLPISMAIQSVGRDLIGPIADEFKLASERVSYGQSLPHALQDLAERCQNQNLRFLAAAVMIQSTAGGNLADVLERLSAVARGRIMMRRKINAITAEAKWSGRFLSAFPVLATLGLLTINPNFYDEVIGQAFFKPLLAVVAAMLLVNMLYMRWIAKLD